jgi:hypothetical protein
VARLAETGNREFLGKTGRNPPPCAARGAIRLGGLLIRFPIIDRVPGSGVRVLDLGAQAYAAILLRARPRGTSKSAEM